MKKRQTAIVKEMSFGLRPLVEREQPGYFTIIDASELFAVKKRDKSTAQPLLKIIYLNKKTTNN